MEINDNIAKALIFENTILDVLKQICIKRNKMLKTFGKEIYEELNNFGIRRVMFDGIAPNGINDDVYTFVEIKFSATKRFIKESIDRYIQKIKSYDIDIKYKILFITILKSDSLLELSDLYSKSNIKIEIWGEEDVVKLINKYPIDLATLNYANIDLIFDDYYEEIRFSQFKEKNEIYKQELRKIIYDYGVTLVLGTGVSLDFKTLNWKDIVNNLYNNLNVSKQFYIKESALKKIGNDNLSISEYCKSNMTKKDYANIMYNALYSKYSEKEIKSSYTLCEIAKMIGKFNRYKKYRKVKKVITYNYDSFLEILLNRNLINYNIMSDNENFLNNYIPIYHVHGYLPYNCTSKEKEVFSESIVLTENDYFKLYNNSSHWQVVIQLESFKDDVCLFIGNSITDFNEKKLLNYTRQNNKNHYAIFCKDGLTIKDLTRISAYFLTLCNVKIIWVDNPTDISGVIRTL